MDPEVLHNEPALALFVPDEDGLVFYRNILTLGRKSLKSGGAVYFELNPKTAEGVADLFLAFGYERVEIKKDMFGKDRMIRGFRPLA
jgi:release factor glutamine methyltransferase